MKFFVSDLLLQKISPNSLPNDKLLDWSKLKAFANDKFKVAEIMIYIFDTVENIVGKGENAGYKHFPLFPQCFQKASFSGSLIILRPSCSLVYLRNYLQCLLCNIK